LNRPFMPLPCILPLEDALLISGGEGQKARREKGTFSCREPPPRRAHPSTSTTWGSAAHPHTHTYTVLLGHSSQKVRGPFATVDHRGTPANRTGHRTLHLHYHAGVRCPVCEHPRTPHTRTHPTTHFYPTPHTPPPLYAHTLHTARTPRYTAVGCHTAPARTAATRYIWHHTAAPHTHNAYRRHLATALLLHPTATAPLPHYRYTPTLPAYPLPRCAAAP